MLATTGALVLACGVVALGLAIDGDAAAAEPSPGVASNAADSSPSETPVTLPSYLDAASMQRLRSALFAAGAAAPAAADSTGDAAAFTRTAEPQLGGASAFGSGLSHFLPEVLRSGRLGSASALTTADFSSTLVRARRDTGEVRALAEEVRRRAEEISQRFVFGSGDRPAATAGAGADVTTGSVSPQLAAARPATADTAADAAAAAPPGAGETQTAAVAPAAAPTIASASPDPGRPAEATAAGSVAADLEGRMSLGHAGEVAALPPVVDDADDRFRAAGIEVVRSFAPEAAPPPGRRAVGAAAAPARVVTRRLPGMARPEQHRGAGRRSVAGLEQPAKPKRSAPAAAPAAPVVTVVAAKPPIVKSSAEVAAAAAAGAAAQSAPKPASGGGLFSSVKPFAVPRTLEALGWADGN